MKCPKCNSMMALVDFCEDIKIYRCPECLYDCTVGDVMTKQFTLVEYSDKGLFIQNNETNIQYYQGSKASLEQVVEKLNEQHETIQFKRKHILCLQSVIQTIDVEIQEKGMTKERFEEIKNYWYQKFKGDRE